MQKKEKSCLLSHFGSVIKTEEKKYYHLTHPQQMQVITENTYPGTPFANMSFTVKFNKIVDFDILEKAINMVIFNNDGLRLRIVSKDFEVKQYVAPFSDQKLDFFDFSSSYGQERYNKWLSEAIKKPFKLYNSDLFYYSLVKFNEKESGFFLKMHHIIGDGWTIALVNDQVINYYNKLADGIEIDCEKTPCYIDYIKQEDEYLESDSFVNDKKYWNEKYTELPEDINLSIKRSKEVKIEVDHQSFKVPKVKADKIFDFCQQEKTTFYRLFMSALYGYISKIISNDDITLGMLNHGRSTADEKKMTGMFVSTFPLRLKVDQDLAFMDFMKSAETELRHILKNHQRYPYDIFINDLREMHDKVPGLLNIILVGQERFSYKDIEIQYHHAGSEQPPFNIMINVFYNRSTSEGLEVQFITPKSIFKKWEIERIFEHLMNIIIGVIDNPQIKISQLDPLSSDEKELLLHKFNDTELKIPQATTILDVLEEQAKKFPDKTAVVFKEERITYSELNQKVNSLAHFLRKQGTESDDIIGIMLDPSIHMLLGPLAIMKAGAAYMPLDTKYSADRIKFMIDDSGAKIILSQKKNFDKFENAIDNKLQLLDIEDENYLSCEKSNIDLITKPDNLAYIIYTSGSTGKPKGVMIEHHSLLSFSYWYNKDTDLSSEDRIAKYAGFGFDASIIELFPPLIAAAETHIIDDDIRFSPRLLNEYFESYGITRCFLPTQFFEQFMDMVDNKSLKSAYTGGEKLKNFKTVDYKILNGYGPTESTVYATTFEVDKDYENIPIGKPIANTKIYIIDKNNSLMPVGYPGELCISGSGLARGYLNRKERTDEVFVDNPFEPGTKMYHTGDLARWLPDGNIEFLGRIDFQLKIRGFRVETGEIEFRMLQHPDVNETIVVGKDDINGNKYLCAYFTAETKQESEDFKEFLKKKLPYYMIPSFLIQLEKMPLNTSGKIDRKALPEPRFSTDVELPTNGIEEKLVEIWEEVLDIKAIGINENFFTLGGHSLKIVSMQSKIERAFSVDITFNDIFKSPTIKAIGEIIKSAKKVSLTSIEIAPEKEFYPVTSAQKRLFFIEQMKGVGTTYNIPFVLEISGYLKKERLSKAFDDIVQRHESLRTSFQVVDGIPMQKINEQVRYQRNYSEIDEKDVDQVIREFVVPFSLESAPLFRLELLKISSEKHLLLIDIHHAIFDGTSMVIFVKELMELYSGKDLPPMRIQYKDFAEWQSRLIYSDDVLKQEAFWLESLSDVLPVLDMPTDFPRPPILDYIGEKYTRIIDPEMTDMLKSVSAKAGVTLNMVLMAAYYVLLGKYSSQDDMIVGMGSAGRNHIDIQNTLGMFVNTLPVRNFPETEKTFINFLDEVKNNFLNVLENQDFPLESIVKKLNIKRDSSRNPLFDVAFVMQSMGFPEVELDDIKISPRQYDHQIAHVDMMLEIVEAEGSLITNWEYRTSLFKKDSIERIADHFKNILKCIISDPGQKIKDINLLSEDEENQLLYDFNQAAAKHPHDKTVHQIFEEQVEMYPDRIAVVIRNETLTYSQLNKKANQLARFLRDKGVKPDSIVGIMIDKTLDMIIGMIAIMKAGGCYLPIKPDFPKDRTSYMLENSKAPILLTAPRYYEKITDYEGEMIDFTDQSIYTGDDSNLLNTNSPDDMIYIIYTSGSTGKPKGVMLEHHNVVRLFKNDHYNRDDNYYHFSENDVWSMFHSFCFDFSVWEMYGALLYGGKLVMVTKDIAINPSSFLDLLKTQKVTVLSQTPGAFYNLIEEDLKGDDQKLCIRYVTFGGEALKPAMLKNWNQRYPQAKLINMYGITETTVHVTYKEISPKDMNAKISNIGVPIATLNTYIMDQNQQLVPIGVPGEICIGGDGVCRGYLGRKDLTEKAFIKNPYKPDERIYKSGDLAKMLPNGEMEYLGRIDFQVKIRGFRIELGEIENQLLKSDAVNKTVVIAKEDKEGNKFLVSYLVMEKDLTITQLREHIMKDLPDYMVPSYFMKLDEMPLTANGKVSRKTLPEPDEKIETGVDYVASRTDVEKTLVDAWQKVLKVEKISVLDNFFALGGHSLKAVTLVAELQKNFEVSVNDIFEHQTIAKLADNIKVRKKSLKSKISELKKIAEGDDSEQLEYLEEENVKNRLEGYRNKCEKYKDIAYDKITQYNNVLLSGATGYLGVYTMRHLLEMKECDVYVIVRGKDQNNSEQRLIKKCEYYFGDDFYKRYQDRLIILNGDLGQDNLGLKDDIYSEISEKIDCIIHTAANVRHYGHYDEFYNANVQATLNLLQLAKTGKIKDFNHVSTLSVFEGSVEGSKYMAYTEYDLDLGQWDENYYIRTKVEAEKAVYEARKDGIKTNIYRVGNISIDSQTGHLQENINENAFFLQLRSFINLGVVPTQEDAVEFAFVDYLSKSIVLTYDRSELVNETYHLFNSNMVKLSDILTSPSLKLNVSKLPFDEFIDFLDDNYDVQNLKPYIESIMLHRGWMSQLDDEEDVEKDTTKMILLSEKTNLILDHLGFKWPELDVQNLTDMIVASLHDRIEFLKEIPFFSKLSDVEIQWVARYGRQEIYADDSELLWEGDSNEDFYLIVDGNVELSAHSKSGWVGTIGLIGSREFFGEESIMSKKPSSLTAQALLGEVTVLKFNGEDIRNAAASNSQLGLGLLEAMTDRVDKLRKLLVNIG